MPERTFGRNNSHRQPASFGTDSGHNYAAHLLGSYRKRSVERFACYRHLDTHPQSRRSHPDWHRDHLYGYRTAGRLTYIYCYQCERLHLSGIRRSCHNHTTRCPDRACCWHGYSADLCRHYRQCRDQRVTLYRQLDTHPQSRRSGVDRIRNYFHGIGHPGRYVYLYGNQCCRMRFACFRFIHSQRSFTGSGSACSYSRLCPWL